jgi:hypothetical protein
MFEPRCEKCLNLKVTAWKINGLTVKLNSTRSHYSLKQSIKTMPGDLGENVTILGEML